VLSLTPIHLSGLCRASDIEHLSGLPRTELDAHQSGGGGLEDGESEKAEGAGGRRSLMSPTIPPARPAAPYQLHLTAYPFSRAIPNIPLDDGVQLVVIPHEFRFVDDR
jgi:hypothetical protein